MKDGVKGVGRHERWGARFSNGDQNFAELGPIVSANRCFALNGDGERMYRYGGVGFSQGLSGYQCLKLTGMEIRG
jgi:hypothetical protein